MVDLKTALELNAADYRERYMQSFPDPGWWVMFPFWMQDSAELIKSKWYTLAGHPLGYLRGFEFWDGPRYTYDQENDTWTEEKHGGQ